MLSDKAGMTSVTPTPAHRLLSSPLSAVFSHSFLVTPHPSMHPLLIDLPSPSLIWLRFSAQQYTGYGCTTTGIVCEKESLLPFSPCLPVELADAGADVWRPGVRSGGTALLHGHQQPHHHHDQHEGEENGFMLT